MSDTGIALEMNADASKMAERIEKLEKLLYRCRNELCLKCGNYHEDYDGACDGCIWKDEWRDA